MSKHRMGTILIWVGAVLLVFLIGLSGASKLFASAEWAGRFIDWGLPAWLVPVVGVAEVLGCILILIPRVAPIGGVMLAIVMLGATFTHLFNEEANRVPFTIALMAIALTIALVRFNRGRAAPATN